jgi:phosphopantetheinyl transferase (holo-ACP synthase)
MLWSLWAAKEAAFKAWVRSSPALVFRPSSFEVVLNPVSGGATVQRAGSSETLKVTWSQGPDWAHATAAATITAPILAVRRLSGDESLAVRALAVQALAEAGYPGGRVEGRPPVYRWAEGEIPVSLSHDGPYGAVVFPSRP